MYYTLINNIKLDSEISIYDPQDLPIELDFLAGKLVTTPIETPMVFTTNALENSTLRDFDDRSIPLMSHRFLKLLQESGVNNLQTFPVIIKSVEDGTIWNNYFAVNILGVISCADLTKSSYSEIMPGHYRFRELAIDATKANGTLLFRLKEHTPTIIMHRSVGQYIKAHDPEKTLIGWSVGKIIQ